MKKLFVILLLLASCAAQEIRRPTTDADAGSTTWANTCGTGTTVASESGVEAYDAAGQSTTASWSILGMTFKPTIETRLFSSWETTSKTYNSLTLNVNSENPGWASAGDTASNSCIRYSANGGASWTTIRCDADGSGWAQVTDVITLSPTQDLSKLRVGVCLRGGSGFGTPGREGTATMFVSDIWTVGANAPVVITPGGNTARHRSGVLIF